MGLGRRYRHRKSGVVFETEYQAVLNYAVTNSIAIPDNSTNIRNNNRVKYLKQTSLWGKFDLLYFFDQPAGLADFAKINYISPSNFYLSSPSEPSFIADNGFKGDGISQYFNTNYIPSINSVKFTNLSCSVTLKGFDVITDSTLETFFAGRNANNQGQIFIAKNNSTTALIRILEANTAISFTVSSFNDFCSFNKTRTNGASYTLPSFAGTSLTPMGASSFLDNQELYILALNAAGTPSGFSKSGLKYIAFGEIISTSLSSPSIITDFKNIMEDSYTP
jgi:hypothetical protein